MPDTDNEYQYTEQDFLALHDAYVDATSAFRPDQYQLLQNNLVQEVAKFLLKPFYHHPGDAQDEKEK